MGNRSLWQRVKRVIWAEAFRGQSVPPAAITVDNRAIKNTKFKITLSISIPLK